MVRPVIPPELRQIHTSRTEDAILIGYSLEHKGGYLIYRPTQKKVVIRDHVNAETTTFPKISGSDEENLDHYEHIL
jgi:hypothetical protein